MTERSKSYLLWLVNAAVVSAFIYAYRHGVLNIPNYILPADYLLGLSYGTFGILKLASYNKIENGMKKENNILLFDGIIYLLLGLMLYAIPIVAPSN